MIDWKYEALDVGWIENGSDINLRIVSHLERGVWILLRKGMILVLEVLIRVIFIVPNRCMDILYKARAPSLSTIGQYTLLV